MTNMPRFLNLAGPLAENTACDGGDVHDLKTLLADLGHYQVPGWGVTDHPDRALFDAIRAYQKERGLKVDGVLKPGGETEVSLRTLQTQHLKGQAEELRAKGRNGDTILAHISPAEARLLDAVTDGGSINPETGLPEFFDLSGMFGGIADGFSKSLKNFGDAFGSQFADTAVGLAGEVAKRKIGDYVSKKIGGPLGSMAGDMIGKTVGGFAGDALGNTLSGGLSDGLSPAQDTPKRDSSGDYGSMVGYGLKPTTPAPAKAIDPVGAGVGRFAANQRVADGLLKTRDYSAIKPHTQDGFANGGETGRAEVLDLAQQMDDRQPGAGQWFAQATDLAQNGAFPADRRKAARHGVNRTHATGATKDDEPSSRQTISDRKGARMMTETERKLGLIEGGGRIVGFDKSADLLDHYRNGQGKPKEVDSDWLRSYEEIQNRENDNKVKISEQLLKDKSIMSLKDGQSIPWNHDQRNKAVTATGFNDLHYATGKSNLDTNAHFTITRKGDKLLVEGASTNMWHDRYDFNTGGTFFRSTLSSRELHELETQGKAKPFAVRSTWNGKVSGEIPINPDGTLGDPKLIWTPARPHPRIRQRKRYK